MADIIQLLPDAVANQIAAGEVIQRPASVVKELLENAIDSGADKVSLFLKDAGKTLVQVVDNGKGMSETDARMAFERHATSKIHNSADLFQIRTKGFRGEALASIASIAQVELKTRLSNRETGTCIKIEGSEVTLQEPVSCSYGSNFMVRNLFFNVPARRKFLKTNSTEFKHILNEFQRVAIAHPDIEWELYHQDNLIYHLQQGNSKQRIVQLFGKHINQNLVRLESNTPIISISGYVGKPEFARKTGGEQYFLINQRYMRHPYFHRAILNAYNGLIPADSHPSYFLFFEADPATIDINIHPSKTEIKFENEQAIFKLLQAAIREAIGKTNLGPSIDFDTHGVIDIPYVRKDDDIQLPKVNINPNFNPFDSDSDTDLASNAGSSGSAYRPKENVPQNWQDLYKVTRDSKQEKIEAFDNNNEKAVETAPTAYFQIKGRYIATNVKSGLLIVDQKRAHERILYEHIVAMQQHENNYSQKLLYPAKIAFSADEYGLLEQYAHELERAGFQISQLGQQTISVQSVPDYLSDKDTETILQHFLEYVKQTEIGNMDGLTGKMAASLAAASTIPYGRRLHIEEMRDLVDKLFACSNPNYTPRGQVVLKIITLTDLEQLLGK